MHAGKNKKRSNVYRILKRVKLDVSVKNQSALPNR